MTDFSLAGGSVLVTGAGSGIGAAIAYEAAMAGARVVVNDLVAERAQETCAYIIDRGGTADPAAGDVSTLDGARAVVDRALSLMGSMTGLCNNVGIVKGGPLESLSAEDWKQVFEVDVDTAFYCSQVALPALRASGGAIVNTSSLVAFHPAPFAGAYNAAKAALASLTQQMALEWGPYGIRVNAVAPGLISGTRFTPSSTDAETQAKRQPVVPLRRTGTADDVASVVVFLLGAGARYVSGQVIWVDGGLGVALQTFIPV